MSSFVLVSCRCRNRKHTAVAVSAMCALIACLRSPIACGFGNPYRYPSSWAEAYSVPRTKRVSAAVTCTSRSASTAFAPKRCFMSTVATTSTTCTAPTTCTALKVKSNNFNNEEEKDSSLQTASSNRWIRSSDLRNIPAVFEAYNTSVDTFRDAMIIDASLYSSSSESQAGGNGGVSSSLRPTYVRLRPEATMHDVGFAAGSSDLEHDHIQCADYAAEATLRWCNDFVAALGLCPWAKLSLATKNAIRIKVVPQIMGIDAFERVIRSSATELLRITGHEEYRCNDTDTVLGDDDAILYVDPNIAITFVVALPVDCENNDNLPEFEFNSFHDFAVDLEDRWFDEADAFADACNEGICNDDDEWLTPIGDLVTLAPFHPRWEFGGGGGGGSDSVAWEKRTPFPLVSVVRSDAIEAAGEESTSRISAHNEDVLQGMGSHALHALFEEKVLSR